MTAGGRAQRPKRTLTPEQSDICDVRLMPGQVLVINAFAGTGKTSTLEEYAGRHSDLTFLYMAFNKTAADDASKRFPASVKCSTTHALAFQDVGKTYKEKLGEPRAKTIMGPLQIETPTVANYVLETLNAWLHSADTALSRIHLPQYVRADAMFPAELKAEIVTKAQNLWTRMCDARNREIPMSHDGYLKLWQVQMESAGQLPAVFRKYDTVLLDEAQDTNPTMEAVVRKLMEMGQHRIIFVGDSRQNIYGFRGSVNVMQRACEDIKKGTVSGTTKQLTTSFRYTARIARVATAILNADAANPNDRVKVCGLRPAADQEIKSEAIIGRSNGGIIGAAIDYLEQHPDRQIHFAATTLRENWNPTILYKFDEMMGVFLHSLGRGNEGKSAYIRQFRNYQEICEHAKGDGSGRGGDKELDAYVRLVEKYGSGLPALLDLIVRKCGPPDGVMCFSTAHRSKGLEWDEVTLLEDFAKSCKMTAFDAEKKQERPSRDELNLLYVAATRPRKELRMHGDLAQFMDVRWGSIGREDQCNVRNPAEALLAGPRNRSEITVNPEEEVTDFLYEDAPDVTAEQPVRLKL